jgi:acetoin utilization protein AcuC
MSRTAFVYTEDYYKYDYGPHHPFRISRLKLTHDLMAAYGLLHPENCLCLETRPATEEELLSFHGQGYLDALRLASKSSGLTDLSRYNLGPGDNPVFPGLFEWSCLTAGATIQCAELLHEQKAQIAFNIAGGLHHARENAASGFCYVNDPVLGIVNLIKKGYRVAYVDLDAHHGDGVQWAFYRNNLVLTISFHQHGRTLFPGTGFVNELGEGDGYGYSLNVPLFPHTDDEIFVEAFTSLVP